MRRFELLGTALLVLAAAWPQSAGPGGAPAAPSGASPGALQVNPEATGFDAATLQRVAEHQLRLGTFADDLRQVRAWAEEGDLPAARLLAQQLLAPDLLSSWRAQLELDDSQLIAPFLNGADPLIDWLGLGERTRGERAHVRFALGVLDLAEELPERAVTEFEATRVAASDRGLRGDAIYNLGTLALQEGELWRSRIPELGGQPPAPQPPAAAPGGPPAPGAEEEPPDPLEQARAYYLKAKDHYVERLRLDFEDEDTRANTELVFRRLRELEELEKQREEQQQQEQNPDEQEPSEDEQDQQPKDQEQQDQQQQDQQQQEPQDQEPQDGEPEEPEPQEEPEEGDPQEQEGEPDEGDPQESEAQPQPRDEQYLTKEEVQRLLDRLEQHEELGKQLLERQRQAQRRPTARDW